MNTLFSKITAALEEVELRTGHSFVRGDDGEIDIFQLDVDNHNGPRCSRCGETWCHHCQDYDTWPMCEDGAIDGTWREKHAQLQAPATA